MNRMFIKIESIDFLFLNFNSVVEKQGKNLHKNNTKFIALFLCTNEHS
jgi:hypothetical protein